MKHWRVVVVMMLALVALGIAGCGSSNNWITSGYTGDYSGTYRTTSVPGGEAGIFSFTVDTYGVITGKFISGDLKNIYPATGTVDSSGNVTLASSSSMPGVTYAYTGKIDATHTVTGTWKNNDNSISGTFSGQILAATTGIPATNSGTTGGTAGSTLTVNDIIGTWTYTINMFNVDYTKCSVDPSKVTTMDCTYTYTANMYSYSCLMNSTPPPITGSGTWSISEFSTSGITGTDSCRTVTTTTVTATSPYKLSITSRIGGVVSANGIMTKK